MNKLKTSSREHFGSRFAVISVAAGSAIGLGNIWKFPYVTGQYGGSAFIIVYLACIALIGLPVMISELVLGRRAQKNSVGTFKDEAPSFKNGVKQPWYISGYLGVIAGVLILAFYGVVAGWTLDYTVKAITDSFAGASPEKLEIMFETFTKQTITPVIWQLMFMGITGFIVFFGVKKGIEGFSKIAMPILLVIIIVLAIRSLMLPGAAKGVEFLLKPDFSKLSGEAVLSALGHAFFTLSLGMGVMITYGSYVSKKENIAITAISITLADTLIALLAGLVIFPAVFAVQY